MPFTTDPSVGAPALLCLLFALLAQIASNMANDYFDYVKGSDTAQRVGPRRAGSLGRHFAASHSEIARWLVWWGWGLSFLPGGG